MSEPLERLLAELTLEVGTETRLRHLSAIRLGLAQAPEHSAVAPSASTRSVGRRLAGAAAAFGLVAVPSIAMAQNAVPGDLLHGLKVALEPVQSLIDSDVRAEHRLQELDVLLDDEDTADAAVTAALQRAEKAVAEHGSDAANEKIAELQARAAARAESGKPGVGPPLDKPSEPTDDTTAATDDEISDSAPDREDSPTDGSTDDEGSTDEGSTDEDGGKPEDAGKPEETGKPDDKGRPDDKGKPDDGDDQGEQD